MRVHVVLREDYTGSQLVAVMEDEYRSMAEELAAGMDSGALYSVETTASIEGRRLTEIHLPQAGKPANVRRIFSPYEPPLPLTGFAGFTPNGLMVYNALGHDTGTALAQAEAARKELLRNGCWPGIDGLSVNDAYMQARRLLDAGPAEESGGTGQNVPGKGPPEKDQDHGVSAE